MRILIIRTESNSFGGAEKMLGYYLDGLRKIDVDFAVAVVTGSRIEKLVPNDIEKVSVPDSSSFSLMSLIHQVAAIREFQRRFPFDLIHGWTAREWELASVAGRVTKSVPIGTLHDHPQSNYISAKRQKLMRFCARWGLRKLVCVSHAVEQACIKAGYQAAKLKVIHNGVPAFSALVQTSPKRTFRLGYLGAFSENKGFEGLFEILERLAALTQTPWEILIGGSCVGPSGEMLLNKIKNRYTQSGWWNCVRWQGWVEDPVEFISSLDLLIFPSTAFDSFPNVLLEAGLAGVPVVASRVGGAAEIIEDRVTGRMFDSGDFSQAAKTVASLLNDRDQLLQFGSNAQARIQQQFSLEKMVANYHELYSSLTT